MFSIVIPVYNKADTLPRAVQSVLGQTLADWELTVVDDGSTDEFEKAIAPFAADPRLKIVRQGNAGVSRARNAGMAASTRPYHCFLDADDEWLSDHLSTYAEMIRAFPGADLYVTAIRVVERDGKVWENARDCVPGEG